MPDLKTALSSVLNEWEKSSAPAEEPPKEKHQFAVTTNVSRATFDAVKNNPGKTRAEIINILAQQGFPVASTTSILSRMVIQGTAKRNALGGLYATTTEYVPLKSGTALKKLKTSNKVDRPRKPQTTALPPVLQNVTMVPVPPAPPATPASPVNFELTADYIVKHVSLAEAKRLYTELGQYFG